MSKSGLTKEFLHERDARIFGMRKSGVPTNEIAKAFGISLGAVHSAVTRQLQRLNREALMAYPEVLRLELERLDALQQAIWPLTQVRQVEVDGEKVRIEPDLRATQQVLAIMDRRSKLLGMEALNVNVSLDTGDEQAPQRAVLAGSTGAAAADAFDPETEARQLLELMGRSGVLPRETVEALLGEKIPELASGPSSESDVIEAEVIE